MSRTGTSVAAVTVTGLFSPRLPARMSAKMPPGPMRVSVSAVSYTHLDVYKRQPLYNTPQKYLRQLLDSVLGQTCPNWQLCLADASDAAHGDVAQTVRAYQARDARIVYTKVENKGISANTNACLLYTSCRHGGGVFHAF